MIKILGDSGFIGGEFKRSVVQNKDKDYTINCIGDIYCDDIRNAVEANIIIPLIHSTCDGKLIHISTAVISDTPYYRTKMVAEDIVKKMAKSYTIYRLGWLYGGCFYKEVLSGKNMVLYHEAGYPVEIQKVVKYILANLDRHNNETVCIGGECLSRVGWAKKIKPDVIYSMGARKYDYHCQKPDIIL